MLNLLIRFIIVYFFMSFSMKLMGKRQVGQLQMSELVTAFFLSELATFSVTDPDIPLLYGVIPILVMICLEVIVSFLSIKLSLVKKIFDFEPSILILNGKIRRDELIKNRVTLEELFSQLRLCNAFDITKIKCAVLEPNGQLSVLPFGKDTCPSREDLKISSDEGPATAVVVEGKFNRSALELVGKSSNWVEKELVKKGENLKDVLLAVCDGYRLKLVVRKDEK